MEIIRPNVEIKHKTDADMLEGMFDDLVSKGHITKDITIGSLKLVMKPLSTAEFLKADTIYLASLSAVPQDVVNRVRTVSSLAHAVVSVNNIPVPTDDEEKESEMRQKLHTQLMKLPPILIDNLATQYKKLVDEQNKIYEDLGVKIENF